MRSLMLCNCIAASRSTLTRTHLCTMSAPPARDDEQDSRMEDDESQASGADVPAAAAAASSASSSSGAADKKKKRKKKGKTGASAAAASGESAQDAEARRWLESLSDSDLLNPLLLDPAHVARLRDQFRAAKPFPHLSLPSLLDSAFARTLENELKGLAFYTKSSDLFELAQSTDLKGVDSPLIAKLKSVLYGDRFRQLLQDITGIETGRLGQGVDMSANVYGDTNTLLCHDDELLGRRIAYILYFVPSDWSTKDGGSLDLFSSVSTPSGVVPGPIATSLVPAWNSFNFFEVSPVSFHQVSEVTVHGATDPVSGENRVRLSVSGWFHGAPIERPVAVTPPALPMRPLSDARAPSNDDPSAVAIAAGDEAALLASWLSPDYLKEKNIAKISAQFEEESSIELGAFLAKERYAQLQQALREVPSEEWVEVGPANKQRYGTIRGVGDAEAMGLVTRSAESAASSSSAAAAASSSSSSSAAAAAASSSPASFVSSLLSFLQSRVFGRYLERLTGLTFTASCGAVRRFTPGCYTLAHSDAEERFEEGVDVTLGVLQPAVQSNDAAAGAAGGKKAAAKGKGKSASASSSTPQWDASSLGGSTHYIEEGEVDELMSLAPKSNTLSIVYRTGIPTGPRRDRARREGKGGVIRFVKYVNHRAEGQAKYDLDCVFRVEPQEDDGEDDDDEDIEEGDEEEEEEDEAPPAKQGKAAAAAASKGKRK